MSKEKTIEEKLTEHIKEFWNAETTRIEAVQAQDIERQTDIAALRHDLEVAEHERNETQKELAEWRRGHSQPICNPPEATGEYVDVMGEMPVELCCLQTNLIKSLNKFLIPNGYEIQLKLVKIDPQES